MNEIEQMIYDDQQRQRNYITFLLGSDNFDICHFIRNLAKEHGDINLIYDDCYYIAGKFNEYDKRNYDIMSEYESLSYFLKEYDKEIKEFLLEGAGFEIREE